MEFHFVTRQRVEFCDTDMAGIVHFANFYRYVEQAEHAYFRSLGLSIMEKQSDGTVIGWPRVSASCNFEAPAYYEDLLDIRLFIARIGVKSLNFEFEFWRDDLRLARGKLKTVCCLCRFDEPLESIEIPPDWRARFEASTCAENPASDDHE